MTAKELCKKIMKQFIGVQEDELTTLESNILKIVEKQVGLEMSVNKYGELVIPK